MKLIIPLWIVAALGAALQGYYLTQLPERVAVHFNAAGEADRWATPLESVIPAWVVLGIMTLLGTGIVLLLGNLPDNVINLPNKEYWLDPVRRGDTIAWLQRFIAILFLVPLLVLITVFHCGFEYNLGNHEAMRAPLWAALIVAAVVLITGIVIVIRRFRMPATPQ